MFSNGNDMVECPYNKAHRMLRRRLQTHLQKCRIHHPDVELRKCPFNLTHLIPESEYTHHTTNCPDRKLITQYKYGAPEPMGEEVPKHAPIKCDDWDDTDVNDYDPQKYSAKASIIRLPNGTCASERKKFIQQERKRLGDADEDDICELSPATSSHARQRSRPARKRSKRRSSYHNGGRCEVSNKFSHTNQTQSYYDHNDDASMPEAPPPPMISYPSPSSYLTQKNPPSASD